MDKPSPNIGKKNLPKHICVLTCVHDVFDGRIFHRQCKTLIKAGYKVTLIGPADFKKQRIESITVLGVPKPANRLQRPLVWLNLFRITRRLRPDVVHFHDPELLLLVPIFRLSIGSHLKIVYDVHEYFVDSLEGKHWIYPWLQPFALVLAKWMERLLIRGVHGIICVVDGQRALYNGFRGPISVLRNLPLASLFEDAKPHPVLNIDGFKLIYAGLLLPERGIEVLLEAMRTLHLRGVKDIHLFLIGPDTSLGYVQTILELAKSYDLGDHVRWLGYVPHDRLKHYLANADVGMVPGLRTRKFNNPGLSTKLFEYMISGLPVVCVDHLHHHRDYVEIAKSGLIVPIKDVTAHAEAILWLRNHPDEARAMGQRGRAMVLSQYTWEHEQTRLMLFYQHLITASRTSGSRFHYGAEGLP